MSQSNNTSFIEPYILKRFTVLKKVGSGAYGHVWKVQQKSTQKIFALKKIFDAFQHSTDAQRTFRQIQILQQTSHPNIIKLHETMRAQNNKDVYLLFQFMEADLHNVISESILKQVHIKFIIYQIAKALKYLHSGLILHRDLKPSNILINSNCTIKLCDFGLVRSLYNADQSNPVLTEGVATRWYRAPEVLLGSKCYSTPADIWSFGCIIYQIVCQKPLFPGNSTLDQLQKIITFTGYPSQEDIKSLQSQMAKSMIKQLKLQHQSSQAKYILKDVPPALAQFLNKIIVFNPKKRINVQQILNDPIVQSFRKKQEQIISQKPFKTSIDDNRKLGVDQYRKIIYKSRKQTINSYSLPNSNSKSLTSYNTLNKKTQTSNPKDSLSNTNNLAHRKSQSSITGNLNNKSEISQTSQKTTLKNVKSNKDLTKSSNTDALKTNYKFIPNRKSQSQVSNVIITEKDPQKSTGYLKSSYQKNIGTANLGSPTNSSANMISSKVDSSMKFIPGKSINYSNKDMNSKIGYPNATSFYSPKNIELKKSSTVVNCCPFSTKNVVVKEPSSSYKTKVTNETYINGGNQSPKIQFNQQAKINSGMIHKSSNSQINQQ